LMMGEEAWLELVVDVIVEVEHVREQQEPLWQILGPGD
jgi:hypothetical protein